MFSVCFHLQRRQLSRQTDMQPPSSLRGGEPSTAVTVSDALTNARCESPQRAAAEPLPQELIQHFAGKTDLYLPLARDTFTNHSEIHFCHIPLKLYMCYLIIVLFTLLRKYCLPRSSCCFGIALMSGQHGGCLCGLHVWRSSLLWFSNQLHFHSRGPTIVQQCNSH